MRTYLAVENYADERGIDILLIDDTFVGTVGGCFDLVEREDSTVGCKQLYLHLACDPRTITVEELHRAKRLAKIAKPLPEGGESIDGVAAWWWVIDEGHYWLRGEPLDPDTNRRQ